MVKIEIDTKTFEKQLERALNDFALTFAQKLADAAPWDKGLLKASIRNGFKVTKEPGGFRIDFYMKPYAKFLEFGTGIYGPTGQPIQPVSKKALAWKSGVKYRGKYGKMHEFSGSKNWYAFSWVRGIKPMPFIRPTFHQYFTRLLKGSLKKDVTG